jgi:hypothetical protein
MTDPQEIVDNSTQWALTSTDKSIHYSDTPTPGPDDSGSSELDKIMVTTFLTTLAEVSLKIAQRKINIQDKD